MSNSGIWHFGLARRSESLYDKVFHRALERSMTLALPLPQIGRCIYGRAGINQWRCRRGGVNLSMFINTLSCFITSALLPQER